MSRTSTSMQNTHGLRFKFRSRAQKWIYLKAGPISKIIFFRSWYQGPSPLVIVVSPLQVNISPLLPSLRRLSPPFLRPSRVQEQLRRGKRRTLGFVRFKPVMWASFLQWFSQYNPGKSKEGEGWGYLVLFPQKIGVWNGIKRKGCRIKNIKGEALLKTGYCKKECTPGKERMEAGQKEEMG